MLLHKKRPGFYAGALSSVTTCSGSSCEAFFFGFAVVPQYLQLLECSIEGRMAVPTGVRVAVRIRPLLAREVGKLA